MPIRTRGALAALSLAALSLAAFAYAPAFGQGDGDDKWSEASASGAECRAGMELLIRAGTGTLACVTPESRAVLIGRGWGSDMPARQASATSFPPSRPASVPAHPPAAPAGMTAAEKAWLDENPVIRVIYDNRPPIEHAGADGSLLGLSGLHLDHFREFTGADFVPVPASDRTELARALLTGEAHMALAMGNAAHLYQFGITFHPHTTLTWDMMALDRTMVSHRDAHLGLGVLHERNFTIGTIRGYEIEAWIDMHHPHVPYVSIDTHERALDALESGRIDILIEAWAVASHIAASRGLDNLHYLGSVGPEMPLSIAFKNDSVLEAIIKKALDALPDDVRTAEILGEPPAGRGLKTVDPPPRHAHVRLDADSAPAAAAAAGGAALLQLNDMERAWLEDNPVVRFVYMDLPPIEYADDDGRVSGLSAMYVERLEAFTGARFVATPVDSWIAAFSLVTDGTPSISLAMTPNSHSFGHYVLTTPHSTIEVSLVTKGPIDVSSASLPDFRVGTVRGSAVETWIDLNMPRLNYTSIDTHEHALGALDAGRIDVLLEYWPVAERLAAEEGITGLHNSGKIDFEVVLSAAVSKQNPVLNDIVRKAIYSIPVEERIGMLAAALDTGLPR